MYGPIGNMKAVKELQSRLPDFTVHGGGDAGGMSVYCDTKPDVFAHIWNDYLTLQRKTGDWADLTENGLKRVAKPITSNGYPETDAELNAYAYAIRELFV